MDFDTALPIGAIESLKDIGPIPHLSGERLFDRVPTLFGAKCTTKSTKSVKSAGHQKSLPSELTDQGLLRGVSVHTLLSFCGGHLEGGPIATTECSQSKASQLYALSRPVVCIDDFISHSWRACGLSKKRALFVVYNQYPAAVFSVLVAVCTCPLVLKGVLPTRHLNSSYVVEDMQTVGRSPWCLLLGSASYVIALRTWHMLPWWLGGCLGLTSFLDKLCVHQSDPTLKAAAIRAIGAIVTHSQRMLILWSSDYFGRLWCVFEVASLFRQDLEASSPARKRIKFVFLPLPLSDLGLLAFVLYVVMSLLVFVSKTFEFPSACFEIYLVFIPMATTGVLAMFPLRSYMRDRLSMDAELETFTVTNAECAQSKDRELVLETIKSWYGDSHAFNQFVRHSIRPLVLSHIACEVDIPVSWLVQVSLPVLFTTLDSMCFWVNHPQGLVIASQVLISISNIPLVLVFWLGALRMARCTANKCRTFLADAFVSVCVGALVSAFVLGLYVAKNRMGKSIALSILAFIITHILLVASKFASWLETRKSMHVAKPTCGSAVPPLGDAS